MSDKFPVLTSDLPCIGAALGRVPSGCSILTTQHADRATGILVSWVQQAAFAPPSVSVCIRSGRPVLELLAASQRFLLNLLPENPAALFRHFGRGFLIDEDAFAGIEVVSSDFGPRLADAVGQLGCEITNDIVVGDHVLYVARVVAASCATDLRPYVHIRKNGLNY